MLRELRQVADQTQGHKVVLIGETYLRSVDDLRKMYGPHDDELDLPMDMQVGFPPYGVTLANVDWFRQRINEAETGIGGESLSSSSTITTIRAGIAGSPAITRMTLAA